jgi:hypothetical protein
VSIRHVLLDKNLKTRGIAMRLSTTDEMRRLARRVREGELQLGLSQWEQERLLPLLETLEPRPLLPPARTNWSLEFGPDFQFADWDGNRSHHFFLYLMYRRLHFSFRLKKVFIRPLSLSVAQRDRRG